MTNELPRFSPDQWDFLAVLKALNTSVPIDIIGTLVPLTPVPLFDLIRRATQLHILEKTDNDVFAITAKIPPAVETKLQAMTTPVQISNIIDKLHKFNLLDNLDPRIMVQLYLQAQRREEADLVQLSLTEKALLHQDADAAINFANHLLETHPSHPKTTGTGNRLISMVLKISDLGFANGKGFPDMLPLLQKTCAISDALGDKRSRALLDMHIGRLFYFFGRHVESVASLSAGKQAAEALGDADILNQAAGFTGLFHYVQGEYRKALTYFETTVEQTRLSENDIINPFGPVFLSLSALAFYQFDRAFTMLDIFHRMAEQKQQFGAATLLRAVLGYILLRRQKEKEGMTHIAIALDQAAEQGNVLAIYWAKLFKTYYQFLKGNLTEARTTFMNALNDATTGNLGVAYPAFPWILDMLLEFERYNMPCVPNCGLDIAVEFLMNGPSIPLKGYALRILAKHIAIQKGPVDQIQAHLENSIEYMAQTGFKVEMSKTQIEMARLELSKGNRNKAQDYAREAWRDLPAYAEHFFPDDLQHLIENVSKGPFLKSFISPEVVFNRFSDILEKFVPASDLKILLSRMVTSTNWFFSAERGGFFLFKGDIKKEKPQLLGAVNLTEIEAASENFRPRIKLMRDAILTDRPFLKKLPIAVEQTDPVKMVPVLCLPINLGEDRRCVLYHDNSVLADCFDFLDDHSLSLFKNYLDGLCRQIWDYCQTTQRKPSRISEEIIDRGTPLKENFVGNSPVFLNAIKKAKRIADADFPILIQGETGVGKEIMARWIHNNSPRQRGPYVIIDSTTIAENLMESELFGHEKGAFTGADRQKPGRVELAGDGTLFLDEVGELPLSIQAKLLRVLEEKTFTRVGGSRVHKCNFRLIAATNRDLSKEVQAGRFRQDLFYRLNVLPLQIPPLRDRKEDILLLARHFLEISCKRLKRQQPPITPIDASTLLSYPWPGNIRELKNIIERGALLSDDNHLELQLAATTVGQQAGPFEALPTIFELQRQYIAYVLKTTGGRLSGPRGAATILGLNRSTLYSRMRKLGMSLDTV
ncbi:MAG: sigma-54 dependent transcriptional regulator [Desulfobacterales bacterium]|jgi:transcriptional regulator with GAF, ATPase, and Fis domain/tetratricopeptide (TPR) repeat protein|nr:sigma-54 dependent transcriptional regulator [Desulfobacterales bacterium]